MSNDQHKEGDEIATLSRTYYPLLKGVIGSTISHCASEETQQVNLWVNIRNKTRLNRNFYTLESILKSNDQLEGAKKACGVCDLSSSPKGQFLKLKGICWSSLYHDFDLDFYIHGVVANRPAFKGLAYSYMTFNDTDQHW